MRAKGNTRRASKPDDNQKQTRPVAKASQAGLLAEKGIKTHEDCSRVLMALMADVANERIELRVANRANSIVDSILKDLKRQYRKGAGTVEIDYVMTALLAYVL